MNVILLSASAVDILRVERKGGEGIMGEIITVRACESSRQLIF